jgi:hypothetical protein
MMPKVSSLGSPAAELLCEFAAIDEFDLDESEVQLAKFLTTINDKVKRIAFLNNDRLSIAFSSVISF